MYQNLERVEQNLMRDRVTGKYYARRKAGSRREIHCLETTDRQTARGKRDRWMAEKSDLDATAGDMRMAGLLERFRQSRSGAADHASDDSRAKIFKTTFLRGMGAKVTAIRTSDLSSWIEKEAKIRKWKARTFNHVRLFLKNLFDLAIADRVITAAQNPFNPKIIKRRKPDAVQRRFPTHEQFEQILQFIGREKGAVTQTRFAKRVAHRGGSKEARQFTSLLGNAGIGQAEASDLRVRDLGEPGGRHLFITRRKTKEQFRVLIYPWLRPLINELREQHKHADPDARVFTIQDVKTPLASACRNLGFPRFTQRNLRGMLIKRLVEEGIPPKAISRWQGHTDGGVLIQSVYTEGVCDTDDAAERAYLENLERKVVPFVRAA